MVYTRCNLPSTAARSSAMAVYEPMAAVLVPLVLLPLLRPISCCE
jgi:hypothetical protein